MPQPILEVQGINVYYGAHHAVQGISFAIHPGEIFGLLGPNGAGKTSTLSVIEGLLAPQSGTVTIVGHSLNENPMYSKANMGVQLQSTSFQADLTVREIITLYAGLYGVATPPGYVEGLLQEINLADAKNKRFGQLSGGQQQRVSLLIAIIHNPPLVLLDEPTTGLDPQSRRQLWDRIEKIKETGRSILLTTHSMEEAEAMCDRVAIIDHGRIIAIDSPERFIEDYKEDPRVKAVSRGSRITLEDVFIGLTGREVRG